MNVCAHTPMHMHTHIKNLFSYLKKHTQKEGKKEDRKATENFQNKAWFIKHRHLTELSWTCSTFQRHINKLPQEDKICFEPPLHA